jgi:signal transduction histidine kinase
MDALGQLTGGIAHDFNNLLTVIMGSHELFEATRDPVQAREHVRNANEAAEMGARLTGRLLSFSRQRKLEPVTLDLNEQILGMMDLLRRSIGETVSVSTSLARTDHLRRSERDRECGAQSGHQCPRCHAAGWAARP